MAVEEEKDLRTIPWCTIILVAGALTCHTLVLIGNKETAGMFADIGHSTGGWSNVGLSLSHSMNKELDAAMSKTVTQLTTTLDTVVQVQDMVNSILGETSNSTDTAVGLLQHPNMKTHKVVLMDTAGGVTTREVAQLSFELPQAGNSTISDFSSFIQTGMEDHHGKKGEVITWTPANSVPFNKKMIGDLLLHEVEAKAEKLKEMVKTLMQQIKPALLQVAAWLHSMGEKMMATIVQFSMTIDRVQKIFDQVMKEIKSASIDKSVLVHYTFSLFDQDQDGVLSLDDIHETGSLYGITAFNGPKSQELFQKYDEDGSLGLTSEEYSNFVEDKAIPSAMTYVLRQFSKRLAKVAGNVAAGRKRDEVAKAVVDYFVLQCVNNHTKVSWVSNRLTNGSLVMDFTADILKRLAENMDNPVQLAQMDVGQIVVDEMLHLEPGYTMKALDLMSKPKWWESQGFDLYTQPKMIERVTRWISGSPNSKEALLLQGKNESHLFHEFVRKAGLNLNQEAAGNTEIEVSDSFAQSVARVAHNEVYKRVRRFKAEKHNARVAYHQSIFAATSSSHFFTELLGTKTMAGGGEDEDVTQALNSGVDAKPETLEFAKFLSWNASQTASRFEGYAFDYTCTSSNVLESFADQVKGMVNKVSGFLNTMMEYSTPRGVEGLENKVEEFVEKASDEILDKVKSYIAKAMKETHPELKKITVLETADEPAPLADAETKVTNVFSMINSLLVELKGILPTVIGDLKFSRTEVSAVAKTLDTVFGQFKLKGSPIFQQISSLYKMLWTVYYVFFALITLLLLFYGFWASGWFGGPAHVSEEEPPQPTSFRERCGRCCSACNVCMHNVHNGHLCFWSCILIAEVVILVMFVVAILLCLIAGLKTFVNVGCAQVYILGDNDVCSGTLGNLRKFLATFWVTQNSGLDEACEKETLTACKKIMELMMESAIFTVVGSFMAAIFSFQMLFESASLHEKARWLFLAENAQHEQQK